MSSGRVRFLSVLLLVGFLAARPARGQLQVLARYLFDEASTLEEWEAVGPEFVPPELWGEVRWTGADGHPSPGAMELTTGSGIASQITALGPCLPPAQQLEGRLIIIRGFRKNSSSRVQCLLSLWTYSLVDDCSGRSDGSIIAPPLSNPPSLNEWLQYTVGFLLDEPGIRSLRPAAVGVGDPGNLCRVDSITIQTVNYSEIPLHLTTSLALAVLLALAALWQIQRGPA